MNIKKYGFMAILLLFFVMFTANTFAEVEVIPINDKITAFETAKFDVKIINEDTEKHTFFLRMPLYSKWTPSYTFPSEGVEIEPGAAYKFDVKIKPKDIVPYIYELIFRVSREDTYSYKNFFKIFVYPS